MSKVVVGMSGGVDSSVAAYLLKEAGYEVIGLFMHNWEEESGGHCTAEEDYADVKRVCSVLNIPYYSVNFSKEYQENVFRHFLDEYKKGRTPNPDVLCNREIKFGPFLDFADKIGADFMATGHYAGVRKESGKNYLLKAKDLNKDQSYFLCGLNQNQLSRVIFPLYNYLKPDVRKIAKTLNLSIAEKKDSTGVCFIGERKFKEFLSGFLPAKQGDIIDSSGKKVGTHDGAMFYTIGQRKGLGLGGISGSPAGRWFVYDKDVINNILFVDKGNEERLYSTGLISKDFNNISGMADGEYKLSAKVRYRQEDQAVIANIKGSRIELQFIKPQRAVTCGQYAVLYDGDMCLGGGQIDDVVK